MQAIEVKHLPATNTEGYRLKAFCAAGSLTVDRSCIPIDDQVTEVVAMLLDKLEWHHAFQVGQLKNGNYVAVLDRY